jgi:hypothetical protein
MFQNGDILVVHLVSGQEIVTRLLEQEEGGLLIEAPTYLMTRDDPKGGGISVGFSHYLTCGDVLPPLKRLLLPYHAIVLPRKAPEKIAEGYVRATSGIEIARTMPSIVQRA